MLIKILIKLIEWLITLLGFIGATALVTLIVMMGFVTIGTVFELLLPYKVITIFASGAVLILLIVLVTLYKRKSSII